MLVITDINGNTEALADYRDLCIEEQNDDGIITSTISFVVVNSARNEFSYPLITEESIIEYNGLTYRIKSLKEAHTLKSITAPSTFFDLNGVRQYVINGGSMTLEVAVNFALNGSGWTYENIDVSGLALIPNFGDDNAIGLIKKICAAFDCEVKVAPNKHLVFAKQHGADNDFQFRYGYNIKELNRDVDTTELRTVIRGYGANGLQVVYTSPNASVFGNIHAEPIKDDRITEASTMTARLKTELNDEPQVSIEIAEVDIGETKSTGDKVWLFYEPLGIQMQTRIMSRKEYPHEPEKNSVTIGNRKPATMSDLLAETNVSVEQSRQETRSSIEQTNDRITLEVESVNDSIASVDLKADNITLSVSDLGDRVDSAESSISIQAGLISSKVEKDGVISAINQSAEYVEIDASKINLNGVTHVADTLTIGDGFNTFANIQFNGSDSSIHSSGSGLMIDTSGVTFAASSIDFGTANIYNLNGYVKAYTGQPLELWRSADGTKIRVYQGGYYSEFSASAQG